MEDSEITPGYDNARVAQAFKVARAALGYNQEEFAKWLNTSKPTIARIETLELAVSFRLYARLVRFMAEKGVYIDAVDSDGVMVQIKPEAVKAMIDRLADDSTRRVDRKVGKRSKAGHNTKVDHGKNE